MPTLAKAADKSRAKMLYQLAKIGHKTARETFEAERAGERGGGVSVAA